MRYSIYFRNPESEWEYYCDALSAQAAISASNFIRRENQSIATRAIPASANVENLPAKGVGQ